MPSLETRLRAISDRIPDLLPLLASEEAAKNSLILPFIGALGYDIFDPAEVVPEYTADVGVRKNERVDYAILRTGKPILIIEAKAANEDLSKADFSQLYRYFGTLPNCRLALLSNGVQHQFYTDLDQSNVMDAKPFLIVDMTLLTASTIAAVSRFAKDSFDEQSIIAQAANWKFGRSVQSTLTAELQEPSPELVRFFMTRSGIRPTTRLVEQYSEPTRDSLNQFINSVVQSRLHKALAQNEDSDREPQGLKDVSIADIETTPEEYRGAFIVKGILHDIVEPERVVMKDYKGHCALLLDGKVKNTICQMRFNDTDNMSVRIRNGNGLQTYPIDGLDGLLSHATQLREVVNQFIEDGEKAPPPRLLPLSAYGAMPGMTLSSVDDPAVTCTVVDDYKVNYNGQVLSPSAAVSAITGMEYRAPGQKARSYWALEGRSLRDIQSQL